jgi:hypothetical protein
MIRSDRRISMRLMAVLAGTWGEIVGLRMVPAGCHLFPVEH